MAINRPANTFVETVVCLNCLKFVTLSQTAGTVKRGLNEKAQKNKQLESFNEFCSPLKNMKDRWRFTNEQRQDRKGNQVHVSGDKSSMQPNSKYLKKIFTSLCLNLQEKLCSFTLSQYEG